MSNGHFPQPQDRLRIGSRIFSRDLADTDPNDWMRLLDAVRLARSSLECLCNGPQAPLPMYVARHGNALVLKRSPGSGPNHHPNCPSHGSHGSTGSPGAVSHPAIAATPDGGIRVHLDVPLRRLLTPADASAVQAAPRESTGSKPTRNTLTLLGLLELLWERAGLHRWNPQNAPRRLSHVYRKLQEEVCELHLGRVPASEAIFVPDTALDEPSMRRKYADLASRFEVLARYCQSGEAPVLLIVGEVRSMFDSRYGSGIRVKGLPDAATVWLSKELAADLVRRFRAPVDRFLSDKSDATKLLCIVGATFSSKGALNTTSCSFMETSTDYIPVDSMHEAVLTNALIQAGRRFTKPLRHLAEHGLHPDFLLHDAAGGDWAMEVWGMDMPEYRQRKAEKIAIYREKGMRLWQWNALACGEIPPIPLKTVR